VAAAAGAATVGAAVAAGAEVAAAEAVVGAAGASVASSPPQAASRPTAKRVSSRGITIFNAGNRFTFYLLTGCEIYAAKTRTAPAWFAFLRSSARVGYNAEK
jgi:hypothetical protein